MKNNKKIALAILASSTIAILGISSTFAYGGGNGNGQFKGQGNGYHMGQGNFHGGKGQGFGRSLNAEQRAKLQSMSLEERQAYIKKIRAQQGYSNIQHRRGMGQGQARQSGHNMDPSSMIADIPVGTVDEIEKTALINQYGEERMARDLYNYAYEKYGIQTFTNIAKSEQQHMDSIKVLLDRYNIEAPSDYAKDNDLYNTLKAKIDQSKKDAIEVGITVEMVDIDNIANDIKITDNNDIKVIFTRIGGASYNHLRGFINALKVANYTTDLEWTKYLSEDEVNLRGPLVYKLAEKLEAEGINLPEQASLKYIKENCINGQNNNIRQVNGQRRGQSQGRERQPIQNINQNINQNIQKYINQTKIQKYKLVIEKKYAAKLNSFSQEKLEKINTKIDDLIEKIVNSTFYSNTKKESYVNILLALKDSISNRLNNIDIINDLLK